MRLGIDLVQISRLEAVMKKPFFKKERLFSPGEIAYCRSKGKGAPAAFAGHYAAKEAVYKALGTGFREGLWRDVEVCHNDFGAPYLKLYGTYADTARQISPHSPVLSLSHDGDYAVAQVLWEE